MFFEPLESPQALKTIESSGGVVRYAYELELHANGVQGKDSAARSWVGRILRYGYMANVAGVTVRAPNSFGDREMCCLVLLWRLDSLDLEEAGVSERGARRVGNLHRLERLRLVNMQLGDSWLKHLNKLRKLRRLDLSGTTVSDDGARWIGRLRRLVELNVSSTRITDAGLDHFRGLTNLRELDLTGAPVSEAAVAHLREALPQCRIVDGRVAGAERNDAPG